MHKWWFAAVFLCFVSYVYAQSSDGDVSRRLDKALRMKAAAAKRYPASPRAWYNAGEEAASVYFNEHLYRLLPEETKRTVKDLLDGNDLTVFGENHSFPLPKVLIVKTIAEYNASVPPPLRVTHAFWEYDVSKRAGFKSIETRLAALDAAGQKAYCQTLARKADFLKGSVNPYLYCELTRVGVRVEFADLPNRPGEGENRCCQYLGTCLTGTDVTVFSCAGMTLRNLSMFNAVRKALTAGGKGVLFVGYGHLPYASTDYDGVGLGVMLDGLKDKKVTSVIALGGAAAAFDDVSLCDECQKRKVKDGPSPYPAFYKLLETEPFEDAVLDVVPSGRRGDPVYKNRPADKVLFFSRFYGFEGIAEDGYVPRD